MERLNYYENKLYHLQDTLEYTLYKDHISKRELLNIIYLKHDIKKYERVISSIMATNYMISYKKEFHGEKTFKKMVKFIL